MAGKFVTCDPERPPGCRQQAFDSTPVMAEDGNNLKEDPL